MLSASKTSRVEKALLWLDFETGGLTGRLDNGKLGEDYYPILEVGAIVTDYDLNMLGVLRLPIHQPQEEIEKCHEWALEKHTMSGLLADCEKSEYTTKSAEKYILAMLSELGIKSYDRKTGKGAILAGNGIGFDRAFMRAQMPELDKFLHYRQLDVSALNLTARVVAPEVAKAANAAKEYKHEALADIREYLIEFKFYKDVFCVVSQESQGL